jgi:hypothetical protein
VLVVLVLLALFVVYGFLLFIGGGCFLAVSYFLFVVLLFLFIISIIMIAVVFLIIDVIDW